MADDAYVPVGGWEAAGYGGFTPNYALQTISPYATPTYTPSMSAPQQLLNYSSGIQAGPAAQTTNYTPQQLIASPTQQGYGMTGPLMTNQFSTSRGGAGGGTPAIAQPGTVQNTNTAGGYSGLLGGSAASVADGSGYWDNDQWVSFNSQPSNPYGDLSGSQPSNPYGDLSNVPAMTPPSPYGNLSGSQPQSNAYGNLSNSAATGGAGLMGGGSTPIFAGGGGVQQPGQAYGGLLGSSMPNPTTTPNPANLPSPNANPVSSGPQAQVPGDNYGFPADDQTYMDMPQGPNGQYGSLMGGQDYGDENPWAQSIGSNGNPNPGTVQINTPPAMPISTQPRNPGGTGAQMPGGSPYGQLPATMGNAPPDFDSWIRKASTPIYGSNEAAQAAYDGIYGNLQGAPQQQQDAYLFPTQPLMSPTQTYADGGASFAQPAPMSSNQMFAQGLTPPSQQYQTAFGDLGRTFMPQPDPMGTNKLVDRAPQTGGFYSYGANTSTSPAQDAITNSLGGADGSYQDYLNWAASRRSDN